MKRLGDISFLSNSVDRYGTDSLCQVLTPPAFIPELTSDSNYVVRMVFKPSWHSEFVVTLSRKATCFEYSIHSARISLWQFLNWGANPKRVGLLIRDDLLPPGRWEARGVLDLKKLPGCIDHSDAFSEAWHPRVGALQLDGIGVDACRVDRTGPREFRRPGATPWKPTAVEFSAAVLSALRETCADDDANVVLDAGLWYHGIGERPRDQ